MADPSGAHITRLLGDWQTGDREALDELIPLVYDELRVIASRHLSREPQRRGIQTTALVNEAYMKLVDHHVDWRNRALRHRALTGVRVPVVQGFQDDHFTFSITPHAIRAPALPAGSVLLSSAVACTTSAVPPAWKTERVPSSIRMPGIA